MNKPDSRRPSRREFLALGVGAFVVAATPGVIRPKRQIVRRAVPVMGTIAEVGVVHQNERYAQGAIDAAIAELRAVDRAMTRFSDESEVGRANLKAAIRPVGIGAGTAEVVAHALRWAETSDGAFDPTIGAAVRLWDVGHRQAPPAAAEVGRHVGGSSTGRWSWAGAAARTWSSITTRGSPWTWAASPRGTAWTGPWRRSGSGA
jgi:thiamine biosynthesis lipoprotein ApbE